MRQVNIKELKKNLSRELNDLPLEITKFGRVIGVICEKGSHLDDEKTEKGSYKLTGKGSHLTKTINEKLTEIIKKKKVINKPKTTITTGWINPLANTKLAPKT